MDKRVMLSTLWIFVTLNYIYCDLMGFMDVDLLKQYLTGTVNGMDISAGFLFGAAILMEIPIAMILLSRLLKYRANRWTNIITGFIMTIVEISTMVFGNPAPYYLLLGIIAALATAFIVWYAWTWQLVSTVKVTPPTTS